MRARALLQSRRAPSAVGSRAALTVGVAAPGQPVVRIAAHFLATVDQMLVAALALTWLAATAQRQLRRVSREEFLPIYALGGVAALDSAVDRDRPIGVRDGYRLALLLP